MSKFILSFLIGCTTLFVTAQNSQNINLLYNWHNPSISISANDFRRYNEVWGYEQDGIEYAIMGSLDGVHFLQIPTSSGNLTEVDFVQGRSAGSHIVHRDFKNFGKYLYAVCDQGFSSLQIIDMSYLPDSVHVVYDNDSLIVRAHNLFIDTAKSRLHIFGARTYIHPPYSNQNHAMISFSLENPENPSFLGEFIHPLYTYVHDGYVKNDTAFLNCGNEGFYIGNFTNPGNPIVIADYTSYPEKGYCHSGWMSADEKKYVMADETHGKKLKLMNVENLLNIDFCNVLGEVDLDANAIPHNPLIRDNFIYVAYYHHGLQVYAYSEDCGVEKIAWYDTYPDTSFPPLDFAGAWGTYPFLPSGRILLGDMQSGCYVFEPLFFAGNEPVSSEKIKIYPNPASHVISLSGLEKFDAILIYSLNGSLISIVNNTNTISVEELCSGMYLAEIKSGETRIRKKFIKE